MSARGDEDVCRLDVAMDNSFAMGPIKSVCDLNCQTEQGFISTSFPAIRCRRVMAFQTAPWR